MSISLTRTQCKSTDLCNLGGMIDQCTHSNNKRLVNLGSTFFKTQGTATTVRSEALCQWLFGAPALYCKSYSLIAFLRFMSWPCLMTQETRTGNKLKNIQWINTVFSAPDLIETSKHFNCSQPVKWWDSEAVLVKAQHCQHLRTIILGFNRFSLTNAFLDWTVTLIKGPSLSVFTKEW